MMNLRKRLAFVAAGLAITVSTCVGRRGTAFSVGLLPIISDMMKVRDWNAIHTLATSLPIPKNISYTHALISAIAVGVIVVI